MKWGAHAGLRLSQPGRVGLGASAKPRPYSGCRGPAGAWTYLRLPPVVGKVVQTEGARRGVVVHPQGPLVWELVLGAGGGA